MVLKPSYRQSWLQELEMLEERRQNSLNHLQAYQNRLYRNYNKKFMVKNFNIGDLVLMQNPKNQADREKPRKFEPNWLGPYIIISSFGSGVYQLTTLDGEQLTEPINSLHLYTWLRMKGIFATISQIATTSYLTCHSS
jgi:hypothetical protein